MPRTKLAQRATTMRRIFAVTAGFHTAGDWRRNTEGGNRESLKDALRGSDLATVPSRTQRGASRAPGSTPQAGGSPWHYEYRTS